MGPYLIAFALFCGVICYGLMHRPAWMWHLGFVVFYLLAGRLSLLFFTALYAATNNAEVAFSSVYLLGGLILWIPALLWWFRMRPHFGRLK